MAQINTDGTPFENHRAHLVFYLCRSVLSVVKAFRPSPVLGPPPLCRRLFPPKPLARSGADHRLPLWLNPAFRGLSDGRGSGDFGCKSRGMILMSFQIRNLICILELITTRS